jgi:hypothetical protein
MKIIFHLGYFRFLGFTYDLLTDKFCMLSRRLLMIYLCFTFYTYELLVKLKITYYLEYL